MLVKNYSGLNTVQGLIVKCLTVSVLAAGSSPAVAQFLPPPPSGSAIPVPAVPGFPSVPANGPTNGLSLIHI